MTDKKLVIGLFGFGVVGEGIYKVLKQIPSLNASVKKICIKHAGKKRNADAELFTINYEDILNDAEINVVVELIDDATEAYKIVTSALKNGKAVVSANKKMIANHFAELVNLQKEVGGLFLYEAAVCGSIPIIRNLEEYFDNDLLQSVSGIVNGSTNYILTKILSEGISYKEALQQAQALGFAESDPTLDVEGFDAANKLTILLAHAYGIVANQKQLVRKGIIQLHNDDAAFAAEKNYKIKLATHASNLTDGKIAAFVLPQFVTDDSQLFYVDNEFNGVVIESKLADKQFFYGKGAGRFPTSSAVVSDISALRFDYKYEYRKLNRDQQISLTKDYYLKVYVSFDSWNDVDKWDFESIDEFHSTQNRQYLLGLIHVEKLAEARWFNHPNVSTIVLPNGIVEKHELVVKALKKISLQLGGVH
jgi:homoserine dehydrogenase